VVKQFIFRHFTEQMQQAALLHAQAPIQLFDMRPFIAIVRARAIRFENL